MHAQGIAVGQPSPHTRIKPRVTTEDRASIRHCDLQRDRVELDALACRTTYQGVEVVAEIGHFAARLLRLAAADQHQDPRPSSCSAKGLTMSVVSTGLEAHASKAARRARSASALACACALPGAVCGRVDLQAIHAGQHQIRPR